ncbi:hypothetical protein O0L34_g7972 [Tuta absoluta]|nr:hypothetical protein O0L34_g7972 [Tuta absoluta]
MEKVLEVQRQVRENTKVLHSYMTDLQNWESEMKRKEAALNGVLEQDLPPVRSKIKKEKPVVVKKKPEKRILSSDYTAWDKFDVDKACEEVDMAEVGPPSLDSKKSHDAKLAKLREEAQFEKERGNTFVKAEKWDEAIACYNRAIELVKDDAIYYANRGLCYLKKDSLHQAETDCTEALRLDPTYVKALQRRATARERLGSLRAASRDLAEVLRLEPRNNAAKAQLRAVTQRMGTKGSKSKSSPNPSPLSTPTVESKSLPARPGRASIVELPDEPKHTKHKEVDLEEEWRNGVGESVTVIKTVKKPPHLRSKRALKPIPILEIPLGKCNPEKPPTRLKIIEIEDEKATGDNNNNDSNKMEPVRSQIIGDGDKKVDIITPSTEKAISDSLVSEKLVPQNMTPPTNSVQFLQEWKNLSGNVAGKRYYLSLIDPAKIPQIFSNSLESSVLSEFLSLMADNPELYKEKTVAAYLRGLAGVKRFSALAMFLSRHDKQCEYCVCVCVCVYKEKTVAAYLRGLAGVKRFSALAMFLSRHDKQCEYCVCVCVCVYKEKTVAAYLRGLAGVKRFSALAMFLSRHDKQCEYCVCVCVCVYKEKTVAAYLRGLAGVKRFSALAMFLSRHDKQCEYCVCVCVCVYKEKTVAAYLRGLAGVKRFSALAMFLSRHDKQLVEKLLTHCRAEGCSDADVAHLASKYEL